MENTIKFSLFKEKIIKTNELFSLVCEKTNALEKAQQWAQQLKTRLDLGRNEINILKLKNDTLSHDLKTTTQKYSSLQKQHDKLTEEYNQLQHDTHETINNLQVNYQLTNQELVECKVKLEKYPKLEDEVSQHAVVNNKKKKPPARKDKAIQTQINAEVVNDTISALKKEKEKNTTEIANLQLEVYDLKIKLKEIKQLGEGVALSSKVTEDELNKLKNEYRTATDSKQHEFEELKKQLESLKKKNYKLIDENEAFQVEMSMLQEQRTNPKDVTDEGLKHKEDEFSALKSEFKAAVADKEKEINGLVNQIKMLQAENDKLKQVPELSDSIRKDKMRARLVSDTPTDAQIAEIMNDVIPPAVLSPIFDLYPTEDLNKASPDVHGNPYLVRIVKRRRILLKRKKLLAQRKNKEIGLLQSLISLQKANISFFIGGGGVSTPYIPYTSIPQWTKPVVRKKTKTITQELDCGLHCCKTTHMLLKHNKVDDKKQLLGFFNVKNEMLPVPDVMQQQENVALLNYKVGTKRKKQDDCQQNKIPRVDYDEDKTCTRDELDVEATNSCDIEPCENVKIISCDREKRPPRRRRKSSVISMLKTRKTLSRRNVSKLDLSSLDLVCNDDYETQETSRVTPPPEPICMRLRSPKTNNKEILVNQAGDNDDSESQKMSRVTPPPEAICMRLRSPKTNNKEIVVNQAEDNEKTKKTSFKRPLCRLRRSTRLTVQTETAENAPEAILQECVQYESPQSPTPSTNGDTSDDKPVLIPLEKVNVNVNKLPTSKIEVLFNKLILLSAEEEVLNEIVRMFTGQDPQYIAEAILERVAVDYHDAPDNNHYPAPLMTDVQRTMLGFMCKLEKTNVMGVFESYLTLAEQRLLTSNALEVLAPITRVYLAICKLQKNITRMRQLCCDVFYFCGDLAVPFLFVVLTSWTEVLPHEANSKDMPIARVLVQIVYMKDCNKPGYNLMAMRDLLIKFYGYPSERWDVNDFFKELLQAYLRNPVRSTDFALLLYCKNRPEKWVYDTIEEQVKPLLQQIPTENFKAHVIILIGNLCNRFSSKSEVNYLPQIRQWFSSLISKTTPDVVRRSVYFCLNRLKKR